MLQDEVCHTESICVSGFRFNLFECFRARLAMIGPSEDKEEGKPVVFILVMYISMCLATETPQPEATEEPPNLAPAQLTDAAAIVVDESAALRAEPWEKVAAAESAGLPAPAEGQRSARRSRARRSSGARRRRARRRPRTNATRGLRPSQKPPRSHHTSPLRTSQTQ